MMRALGLTALFVLVVAAIVYVLPDGVRPPSTQPATPASATAAFAPVVPEGETPAAADDDFRAACFKSLEALTAGWTFGDMLFTRSREWGLVLRADYTTPDVEGPNVNRVICSKGADGRMRVNVTMGQKVPPLKTP